jgi:hypothetical protein
VGSSSPEEKTRNRNICTRFRVSFGIGGQGGISEYRNICTRLRVRFGTGGQGGFSKYRKICTRSQD